MKFFDALREHAEWPLECAREFRQANHGVVSFLPARNCAWPLWSALAAKRSDGFNFFYSRGSRSTCALPKHARARCRAASTLPRLPPSRLMVYPVPLQDCAWPLQRISGARWPANWRQILFPRACELPALTDKRAFKRSARLQTGALVPPSIIMALRLPARHGARLSSAFERRPLRPLGKSVA